MHGRPTLLPCRALPGVSSFTQGSMLSQPPACLSRTMHRASRCAGQHLSTTLQPHTCALSAAELDRQIDRGPDRCTLTAAESER